MRLFIALIYVCICKAASGTTVVSFFKIQNQKAETPQIKIFSTNVAGLVFLLYLCKRKEKRSKTPSLQLTIEK